MHIFLIDPLDKLNLKKDSSILIACSFMKAGHEVGFLFAEDLYYQSHRNQGYELTIYPANIELFDGDFYIKNMKLLPKMSHQLDPRNDVIHMRLDPPFDSRYLHVTWLLSLIENKGFCVVNSPKGILLYNEKIHSLEQPGDCIDTFLGSSLSHFVRYVEQLAKIGIQEIILKPLNFFQGIGVEKVSISNIHLTNLFQEKVLQYGGLILAQPYIEKVEEGEIRTVFFQEEEIGTILKIPKKGSHLANIAQGATFEKAILSDKLKKKCISIAKKLNTFGVSLIAFDILDQYISEINITCPGLLVEVSHAMKKNLGDVIVEKMSKKNT